LIQLKLGLLVAVLVAGVLGGAIPLRQRDGHGPERLLAYGNAFAAGFFLGAGLIHMLPDASEAWSALGWHYPMAYLLAAFAVLLMLLFEHVLLPDTAHERCTRPPGSTSPTRVGQSGGAWRPTPSCWRSRSTRSWRGWRSAPSPSSAAR